MRVKLDDIIEAIDLPAAGWRSLLNRQTGEIVTLNELGEVLADEPMDADELESDAFVQLPTARTFANGR